MTPIGVGLWVTGVKKIEKFFFSNFDIFFANLPRGVSELPGENLVSPYSSKSSSIFSIFTIRVIFVILGRKMTKKLVGLFEARITFLFPSKEILERNFSTS